MSSDWAVHFIAPDGRTRIAPWLLLDSAEEVRAILRWGNTTTDDMEGHEKDIRRWSCSSVGVEITERQLATLIERGRRWPWTGYELLQMKRAGKYPPARLGTQKDGPIRGRKRKIDWVISEKSGEVRLAEVQYLRNEEGNISMMPLVDWHIESFDIGLMAQLKFAETPEDFKDGMLGVVQLAVSAEQALQLADTLTKLANRVLASQRDLPRV
jgi:hypothetical protein